MKSKIIYIGFICLFGGILFCTCVQKDPDYLLQGDYLGQEVPGLEAKIFAPGILSTNLHDDGAPVFTPDGKEVFWRIYGLPHSIIAHRKQENGIWSAPELAPFSGRYMENQMALSPDGKRLYFSSDRPLTGRGEPKDSDIWYVDKTVTGWGEPVNPGVPLNTEMFEELGSVLNDGTLYFTAAKTYSGKPEDYGIYYSKPVNGVYVTMM